MAVKFTENSSSPLEKFFKNVSQATDPKPSTPELKPICKCESGPGQVNTGHVKDDKMDEQSEKKYKFNGVVFERNRFNYSFLDRLKHKKFPPEIRKIVFEQLAQCGHCQEEDEHRQHLELIFDLPWKEKTRDVLDLSLARKVLNEEHFGLEEVKERIIEFLAVKMNSDRAKGSILCLSGPPGVGKTSLAKSVARALNRKFVHFSVGGVFDEQVIRGLYRGYSGARQGQIIGKYVRLGARNPVFLIDEIDKVSHSTNHGDVGSALLDVLDPGQNTEFLDHYLQIPFDLSDTLFICTANNIDTIMAPLKNRLEIIEISAYGELEKFNIIKHHLVPKMLKETGFEPKELAFDDSAIRELIELYDCEAGCRALTRNVESVARKILVKKIENPDSFKNCIITTSNIGDYLTQPKVFREQKMETPQVGLSTGLSVSSLIGGKILFIEVQAIAGHSKLELTGHLGEVMKESAKIAITYIKSRLAEWQIPVDWFDNRDLHIHLPQGAVQKDGPSAGIALATAIISLIRNIPVSNDVAMTGEISLRGRILPVGGVKEKVVAAVRSGYPVVIIPEHNKTDLLGISDETLDKISVVPVTIFDEVLQRALVLPVRAPEPVLKRKSSKSK